MDEWRILKEAASSGLSVLDSVIRDAQEISGNASVSEEDLLDKALGGHGEAEHLVLSQEQNFNVKLSDAELTALFVGGTIGDLARLISSKLLEREKTASDVKSQKHKWYMRNAPTLRAESKVYRMAHLMEIRRKARKYRMKVKRRLVRPRKRVGTAMSGFSFVPK